MRKKKKKEPAKNVGSLNIGLEIPDPHTDAALPYLFSALDLRPFSEVLNRTAGVVCAWLGLTPSSGKS